MVDYIKDVMTSTRLHDSYVYMLVNDENKPRYIGKGKGSRMNHPRKYDEVLRPVIIKDGLSDDQAGAIEGYLIWKLGLDNLLNSSLGRLEMIAVKDGIEYKFNSILVAEDFIYQNGYSNNLKGLRGGLKTACDAKGGGAFGYKWWYILDYANR